MNDYERIIAVAGRLAGDVSRPARVNDREYLEVLLSRAAVRAGQDPVAPREVIIERVAPVLVQVKEKLEEAVRAVEAVMPVAVPVAPVPSPVAPLTTADLLREAGAALHDTAVAMAANSMDAQLATIVSGPGTDANKASKIYELIQSDVFSEEFVTDAAISGRMPRSVALALAKLAGREV